MNFDLAEIMIFDHKLEDSLLDLTKMYFLSKYASPKAYIRKDILNDYSLCPYQIDLGCGYSSYQWSTGDTTQSIVIHKHGWVSVTVTDPFGVSSCDSIYVRYPNTPLIDTTICYGDTITLSARVRQQYQHLWSSGTNDSISTDTTLKVWQAGIYWLTLTDSSGCSLTDSVIIMVDSFPLLATLGPDTMQRCQGESLVLAAGGPEAAQYLWHDGSTQAEMPIQAAGNYSVTVHNILGCSAVDSTWVELKGMLPWAEFNMTDSVCLGEPMQFFDLSQPDPQDTSASIIIWYWDFGNGNTSTSQHPLYLFQSPGDHQVKLHVETDAGCMRETVKTVFVYPLPRAAFLTASGCTGIPVPFDDHSYYPIDEGVAWEWNFGDPASGNLNISSLQSPEHVYSVPGLYQVSLIVTTMAGCRDTVLHAVEIFEAPGADFLHSQACEGQAIQFTDISELPPWHPVIGWEWDFGDGSPASSQQHPVHTYAQWGSYTVSMTMQTFRCTVKKVKQVNADPRPLAAFQAADWCVSAPCHFTDQSSISLGSINQWQWNFGVLGTDSLQDPVVVFPSSGIYPVSLTVVSDKGCRSDSLGVEIEVFDPPHANIEAIVNEWNNQYQVEFFSHASQDVILWQWHFGDGNTSELENPFHAYADSGRYQVMLIVTNVHACSDTAFLVLQLLSPRNDLVLKGIVHEIDGAQYRFAADLYNAGTRYIGEVALQVSINGLPSLVEQWTGSMPPDSGFRYLFKGGIPFRPGWSPHYYCIEAEIPGILSDADPGNNLQCEAINSTFTFPDPYPNPAADLLSIDLVLTDEAELQFSVINALGQRVISPSHYHGDEGLNRFSLELDGIPPGVYSLRVMIGGRTYLKRFTRL
ncbi:MAG TPA: PKD domain-containing protein [Bacteroidales bacterium]|nr:PKD domain-containing protein [Bacteroidales bacterium]HSA43405.1 PKD domain-containing protein [Bacteroidales bacterium]